MTPMFTPEPGAWPSPKMFVAAVGEAMTEMCGEVADGMLAHAFTTKRYFEEVTTPALLRGMRAVRAASAATSSCPARCSSSPGNDERRAGRRRGGTRKQIAFYGSTPAYARCSSCTAGESLHTELHRLSPAR